MITFFTSSGSVRRNAAAVCSCIFCAVFSFAIIIFFSFPSSATAFEPRLLIYNLYASGENYGGYLDGVSVSGASGANQTGTFSVPLDLNSRFKWLYLGATYDTVSYDYGAEYKYVITISTGATGSYNGPCPVLEGSVMAGRYNIDYISSDMVSQKGTLETTSGNTYTFTYDNIPYDNVQGKSVFYISLALSNFSSLDSDEIYIVNSYFGLESFFSEDKYNAEMVESLDNIQNAIEAGNEKLDNIEGAVNDVGDKVDEVGDQISGEIDDLQQSVETQHIKEEEYADDKGDSAEEEITGALDDSGLKPSIDDMWTGLKRLFTCLSTTETVTTIPIPEVKVPVLAGTGFNSEVVLIQEQDYDISALLNNPSIQMLIKGAKVLYYLFFFYFMVDYVRKIFAKIFLTDVATNEASVIKKGDRL